MNGFVVTLVVLSFLVLRRAPKAPVKLELRDDDEIASDNAREAKSAAEKPRRKFVDPRLRGGPVPTGWENYHPRHDSRGRGHATHGVKSLNVLFNWNGHTWDAYEVLGIPAGSSSEAAHAAFERAAALADTETLPFLRAAFEAIATGGGR